MKKEKEEIEKVEINPLEDEDLELVDINSDSDEDEDDEEERKGFRINIHLVMLSIMVVMIGMIVFYIWRWNTSSTKYDYSDVPEGLYDTENLDYYVYQTDENGDLIDKGVGNVLFIGNNILSNNGAELSLINELSKEFDSEVYSLVVDSSRITADTPYPEGPKDPTDVFSLPRITEALITGDHELQWSNLTHYSNSIYYSDPENRAVECRTTFETIDMNNIDTIIIMYSLSDYYHTSPTLIIDQEQINCYYGALYKAVRTLKEAYPHISIVISSPTPSYLYDADGNVVLANLQNYGFGNSSDYIDMMYFVATKCCVSYIDNYFYLINDDNITEYVENFILNEKGIDVISKHIINFFKQKPVGNQLPNNSDADPESVLTETSNNQ